MSLILSGTDGLSDIDGSAATPAIRGTDANTGIFFPAADTIAFAEGGAEIARFDSSGNLLVGTTSAATPSTTGFISVANSFGFKNRLINGSFVIDQRNAGASTSPSDGTYFVDRWRSVASQTNKFTTQQTPSATETGFATRVGAGFTSYLACTSSSAYTIGASEAFVIGQLVEGYNWADMAWGTANAKTVTLSFLVYASAAGTYGGSLQNTAGNYSYVFSYSVASANTWTSISVTIAGPTAGTFAQLTNGSAMRVWFSLGAGATVSTTAGSWNAATYWQPTGATNVVSTSGAYLYFTGVQLEKGSTATSFDYRPYGTELVLCQRYYWQSTSRPNAYLFNEFGGVIVSATTARINFNLPTAMRTQPSVAVNPVYNTGSGWQINITGVANYVLSQAPAVLGVDGAAGNGGNMVSISFITASTIPSADYGRGAIPYATTNLATNNFQFSAEL